MKPQLAQLIKELLYEELYEISTTGTGASFTPGAGAQYATPAAFAKKGQGDNRATQFLKKIGYKKVERPKRPSHTKLFDYLQENALEASTPTLNQRIDDVLKTNLR